MNRLFAASLLVVLVSILLATPALAMGPDLSRRLSAKSTKAPAGPKSTKAPKSRRLDDGGRQLKVCTI